MPGRLKTRRGGIRAGTWAADSLVPVVDRGDEAQLRQRHRLVVRLDALTVPQDADLQEVTWRSTLGQLSSRLAAANEEAADGSSTEIVETIRAHLLAAPVPLRWFVKVIPEVELRPLLIGATSGDRAAVRTHVVLTAPKKVTPRRDDEVTNEKDKATDNAVPVEEGGEHEKVVEETIPEVSSEDDSASRTGVAVPLVAHLAHVAEQAEAFARTHGLPLGIATDVVLAAAWHDAGKADPRFQLWLAGGDEVACAALRTPLAKSALQDNDRRRQHGARKRARYPSGARHELASVAMLERADAVLAKVDDRDLVLHLVASHHGWCRPYAPVEDAGEVVAIEWEHEGIRLAASSDHGQAHVGATVVDRFWKMTQKYGWWGLAWLETLVRLADHRASQAEQEEKSRKGTP